MTIITAIANPHVEICAQLVAELSAELGVRYEDATGPRAAFVVARLDGVPAGCGALRPM